MRRKDNILLLFVFFLLTVPGFAQYVTVTGTSITDSDAQVWQNGTWGVEFYPNPNQPNLSSYFLNGDPTKPLSNYYSGPQNGIMDGSGSFSIIHIIPNNTITPTGSQWRFKICPNASSACGVFIQTINAGGDITPIVNSNIKAPRFNAVAGAYGYNDTEAQVPPPLVAGATYWNTISGCQKYFNSIASTWACWANGSGGGVVPTGNTNQGVYYDAPGNSLTPMNYGYGTIGSLNSGGGYIDPTTRDYYSWLIGVGTPSITSTTCSSSSNAGAFYWDANADNLYICRHTTGTSFAWQGLNITSTGLPPNIAYTNVANNFVIGPQSINTGASTNVGAVLRGHLGTTTATFVDSYATSSTITTSTCEGTINAIPGDTLIMVQEYMKAGGWGVTDGTSDVYHQLYNNNSGDLIAFYSSNIVASGPTTLSMSGRNTGCYGHIIQLHGASTPDVTSVTTAFAPPQLATSSNSITTVTANDFILSDSWISLCNVGNTVDPPFTFGANFEDIAWATAPAATPGTYTATWHTDAPCVGASAGIVLALSAWTPVGALPQSADLLQYQDGSGALLGGVNAKGHPYHVGCTATQVEAADGSGCITAGSGSGGAGAVSNLCSVVTLSNATCTSGVISATSGASSVIISGIPATYNDLQLTLKGISSSTTTATNFYMTFNGDTAAHYSWGGAAGSNAGASGVGSTTIGSAITVCSIGVTSGFSGGGVITIPSYADNNPKIVTSYCGGQTGGAGFTGTYLGSTVSGAWSQTTPINTVTLTAVAGTISSMNITLTATGNSSSGGGGGGTNATGTFVCDGAPYNGNLTSCISAAYTYTAINETGGGHGAKVILGDANYTTGGTPIPLNSGITIVGVPPRTKAYTANANDFPPNGGTWIDGGAQPIFTATDGRAMGYRDINLEGVGFKNWTGCFFQAGTPTTVGLFNSHFEHLMSYGIPTVNGSDQGICLYNSMQIPMNDIKLSNVNTGLSWQQNSTASGTVGGNSEITGLYVYTYTKSVANGNSTKPGILVNGGLNLITFYRPQVNSFANVGCTCVSDGTGDGIDLTNSVNINVEDADMEVTGVSIKLVNTTTSYVSLNIGNNAGTYLTVDGTSNENEFHCQNGFCNVNSTSGNTGNIYYGIWQTVSGSGLIIGAYYNAVTNSGGLTLANGAGIDSSGNVFGSGVNVGTGTITAGIINLSAPFAELYTNSTSGAGVDITRFLQPGLGYTGCNSMKLGISTANFMNANLSFCNQGSNSNNYITLSILGGASLFMNGAGQANISHQTIDDSSGNMIATGNITVGNHVTLTSTATANRTLTLPDGNATVVIPASLNTAAVASENVTIQGMTASGHCTFSATNASAATNIATTYISTKAANQITITHTATAGMSYDIFCTSN